MLNILTATVTAAVLALGPVAVPAPNLAAPADAASGRTSGVSVCIAGLQLDYAGGTGVQFSISGMHGRCSATECCGPAVLRIEALGLTIRI